MTPLEHLTASAPDAGHAARHGRRGAPAALRVAVLCVLVPVSVALALVGWGWALEQGASLCSGYIADDGLSAVPEQHRQLIGWALQFAAWATVPLAAALCGAAGKALGGRCWPGAVAAGLLGCGCLGLFAVLVAALNG